MKRHEAAKCSEYSAIVLRYLELLLVLFILIQLSINNQCQSIFYAIFILIQILLIITVQTFLGAIKHFSDTDIERFRRAIYTYFSSYYVCTSFVLFLPINNQSFNLSMPTNFI
jgi:hypothetical protein